MPKYNLKLEQQKWENNNKLTNNRESQRPSRLNELFAFCVDRCFSCMHCYFNCHCYRPPYPLLLPCCLIEVHIVVNSSSNIAMGDRMGGSGGGILARNQSVSRALARCFLNFWTFLLAKVSHKFLKLLMF